MKKLFAMLLLCVAVLAGCSESVIEHADWAQLDEETGRLTVTLPLVEGSNYSWTAIVEDDTKAQLVSSAEQDDTYVAQFRGLFDGEGIITLDFSCMGQTAYSRVVRFDVKDGSITRILETADIERYGINPSFAQPDLMKLYTDNRIENIFATRHTMTCVQKSWTYGDEAEEFYGATVIQFRKEDGKFSFQSQTTDKDGKTTFASRALETVNIAGCYASVTVGSNVKTLTVYPGDEYHGRVEDNWLYRGPSITETVIGNEVDERTGTQTVTTQIVIEDDNAVSTMTYLIDADTGLIREVVQDVFDTGRQEPMLKNHMLITYDQPQRFEMDAMQEVLDHDNACLLTVVYDPGGESEEIQQFHVDRDVVVSVLPRKPFGLYHDWECTQPMREIDVTQDKVTVYVRYI